MNEMTKEQVIEVIKTLKRGDRVRMKGKKSDRWNKEGQMDGYEDEKICLVATDGKNPLKDAVKKSFEIAKILDITEAKNTGDFLPEFLDRIGKEDASRALEHDNYKFQIFALGDKYAAMSTEELCSFLDELNGFRGAIEKLHRWTFTDDEIVYIEKLNQEKTIN